MNLSHSFPATFCRHSWLLFSCFLLEGTKREGEREKEWERLGYNRILVNLFPLASQASSLSWLCYARKWNFSRHFPPKVPLQDSTVHSLRGGRGNLEDLHGFNVISGFAIAIAVANPHRFIVFSYHRLGTVSSAWHSCYPVLCMHYNIIILIYLPLSPTSHTRPFPAVTGATLRVDTSSDYRITKCHEYHWVAPPVWHL